MNKLKQLPFRYEAVRQTSKQQLMKYEQTIREKCNDIKILKQEVSDLKMQIMTTKKEYDSALNGNARKQREVRRGNY
jgi:hypothetical protein